MSITTVRPPQVNQLQEVLSQAQDIIFTVSNNGTISYLNKSNPYFSSNESLKYNFSIEQGNYIWEKFQYVVENQFVERFLMQMEHHVWYSFVVNYVDNNESDPIILFIGRDVSFELLHQNEINEEHSDRLKMISAQSGTASWEYKIDTHKFTWDTKLPHIFGSGMIEKLDSIEDFMARVHPLDKIKLIRELINAIRLKLPFEKEVRILSHNGYYIYLNVVCQLLFDRKNKLKRVYGICTNINEKKKKEEILKDALFNAEKLNKELEQFAHSVSHDLKEPLRNIAAYLKLIQKQYQESINTKGQEMIGHTISAANRLQEMITGLLQLTKISDQEEKEPLDLFELVNDVQTSIQKMILESSASIKVKNLPHIYSDKVKIGLLFQNLICNSIKFARKDVSPKIHIYSESTKDCIYIYFKDNGIGIEDKFKENVFQVFKKLNPYYEYEGSGIGLSLCKKIVENYKGQIKLEPNSDYGVTVVVTLPKNIIYLKQ